MPNDRLNKKLEDSLISLSLCKFLKLEVVMLMSKEFHVFWYLIHYFINLNLFILPYVALPNGYLGR